MGKIVQENRSSERPQRSTSKRVSSEREQFTKHVLRARENHKKKVLRGKEEKKKTIQLNHEEVAVVNVDRDSLLIRLMLVINREVVNVDRNPLLIRLRLVIKREDDPEVDLEVGKNNRVRL